MTISHKFVETIPAQKEVGVLYISIEFAVASHLCPCGCGNLVVTPFAPHNWSLIFDGVTISLTPSIGNWDSPCQSHYFIKKSQIKWAGPLTNEKIARVRARDARDHQQSKVTKQGKKRKSTN